VRQADKEGFNTDMIILTGHGDRADAVAAIKAHVFDLFDKHSLNMSELLCVCENQRTRLKTLF
jgi:DNA-binding NtrC family response regulator